MTIVIATGGSGGHLFPALKVAEVLKSEGHDVVFAGSFGLGVEKIEQAGFSCHHLEAKGLNTKNPIKFLSTGFSLTRATMKAKGILKDIRPDAVIGFGSYGAFPVVMAARLSRIPAMIHEQNVLPGKANTILAKYVNKIAVTFLDSKQFLPQDKVVLTGTPVHARDCVRDPAEARHSFGLNPDLTTVLVFGGSQGSHAINENFLEALPLIKKTVDFQVIHVTGKGGGEHFGQMYKDLQIPVALFGFLDNIEEAYVAADLAVCRSGALTVMELAKFQLPAILIPYPYAGSHQIRNASVLCRQNAGTILEEKHLTPESLAQAVQQQLNNRKSFQGYLDIYKKDSANILAREITALTSS
ncbi:MAG: undecaprenyldiphospho-muramoylpentapeptide beta-N-acetylglucosaminyltransferase [Candidatus Omnitrophica bacterium]|nr:undecaprenyldiphospho-muramoylpentapeptide beta-N-acetylglucosaminyltransferase [Candidatus Omnitrophota bacterium]